MSEESKPMEESEEVKGSKVTLVSQEGDNFQVSMAVATMSELVKTMIDGIFKCTL